jgi:hypothetical protein
MTKKNGSQTENEQSETRIDKRSRHHNEKIHQKKNNLKSVYKRSQHQK